jgi:Cu+-exporting ATPase
MPRIGSARIDPGCGATAMIEGHEVALGNRAMMRRAGIDLGRVEAALLRFEREGKMAVVVAADARVLGVLAIADPVRRHAAAAISMLAAQNMRTDLVTADQHPAASRVAVELGVTGFRATMQPADVLAVIRALEVQGRRVALVGACGNDNSALAAATVALAFGKGTDPDAVAGVMLTRADPRLVPATIDIARHTIVAVRRNLFLALLYNAAAIPLAALGLLTPAVAVAAMALSILSVAVISLWLKRWKPQFEQG